jgi:integrase
MAHLTKLIIEKTVAGVVAANKEQRLWDDNPRGLGLRIKPSGAATFFLQYRSPLTFMKVRLTLGKYGALTLDQARDEARKALGAVAVGRDPSVEKKRAAFEAATAATVSEFCDAYQRDAKAGLVTYRGKPKKPATIGYDSGRIERHIKPTLGGKLVREVTRRDVERAMHSIRQGETVADVKTGPRGRARVTGGAGAASRVISLLGSIFSYSIKCGIRDDNPVSGVERPKDGKRERYLKPDEYAVLGEALNALEMEGHNRYAIHAARVLALTGCRKGEILSLKRGDIDAHSHYLMLRDTKTGTQARPIGAAALNALANVPGGGEFVFPASRGGGHLVGMKPFTEAAKRAGLEDVTLHVLRHSFATIALELEYSELTIAGLLGHRLSSVTSRYAHGVDKALATAADRVSALVSARMECGGAMGAEVVDLRTGGKT